jgi:hypothetical protein
LNQTAERGENNEIVLKKIHFSASAFGMSGEARALNDFNEN